MEVMKRLFLVLFFLLALFSCRRAGTANNIDDISLAKVYLAGKLKVGVDIPFAPLSFMEQNEYVGYDIDVINEMCAIMDIQVEYVQINWDKKYQMLQSGEIDMIASGFSESAGRANEYGTSLPLIKNVQCIVVRADETRINNFDDLNNLYVGCQPGTTAESYLKEKIRNGFDIRMVISSNLLTALRNLQGRITDALIADLVVMKYIISENQSSAYKILNAAVLPESYVYAFRKDDIALIDAVNTTLQEMAEDGVLSQITKKWFVNDVSLIR
jgi:extracellular solute-binding protein family 3